MTKILLLATTFFLGLFANAEKPTTDMKCEHGTVLRYCTGGNAMVSEILLCSEETTDYTWFFKGKKLYEEDKTGDKVSPEGKVRVMMRATGATTYKLMLDESEGLDFTIGSRPFLDKKRKVAYRIGNLYLPAGKKQTITAQFKCY